MRTKQRISHLALALLIAGCETAGVVPPSSPVLGLPSSSLPPAHVGDIARFRVRNAYNGESLGEAQYRVDKIDGGYVFVGVSTNSPYVGSPRTEIYTAEGNWLRHVLLNHDQAVDYEFAPPYPAYLFPLEAGKAWSVRVNARNLQTGRTNSVRVDAEVIGGERIMTEAGAFDVVKIRRRIYAGDWDGFLRETNIAEFDWFAPELGRSVRFESNSNWLDMSRSPGGGGMFGGMFNNNQLMRGDWRVFELLSYRIAGKSGGGAPELTTPAPPSQR